MTKQTIGANIRCWRESQTKKKFYTAPNAFLHAPRLSFKGAKAVPARKYPAQALRQAGICVTAVRFQGTIHDLVMLNALAHTTAARGAIPLATAWLRAGFSTQKQ
jgi:hypothetical protein